MNFNFIGIKNISRAAFLLVAMGVFSSPLWAQQAPDKTQDAETKRDIRWGEVDSSGLRLGVFRLDGKPTIFCVIENAGENPVTFNDYFLGYSEAISIQARPKGTQTWLKILEQNGTKLYKSAGPAETNKIVLAPHQYYRSPKDYFVIGSPNTSFADSQKFKQQLAKLDVLKRESEGSSFWFNIYDYNWPEKWSGTIEFKIRQKLPNFNLPNQWQGELESGILEADAAEIRSLAIRANYQMIFMRRQTAQADVNEQSPTKTEPQK